MAMAAAEISKLNTNSEQRPSHRIADFCWGIGKPEHYAAILRTLADQVEQGRAIVQATTFKQMADMEEFTMYRWSIKFAEKSDPPTTA